MKRSTGVLLLITVCLLFVPAVVSAEYTVLWTYGDFGLPDEWWTNNFIGDIDGDSQMEICARAGGNFFIADLMTGVQEFSHDFGSQPEVFLVMDLDRDGTPEVVLKLQNADLAVIDFVGTSTAVPNPDVDLGVRHDLDNAYPNPFNAGTTIPVSLGSGGHVELRIYDAAGRVVRHLVNKPMVAGGHNVEWDGVNDGGTTVASGMYFYELRVDGRVVGSQKAVVLK